MKQSYKRRLFGLEMRHPKKNECRVEFLDGSVIYTSADKAFQIAAIKANQIKVTNLSDDSKLGSILEQICIKDGTNNE